MKLLEDRIVRDGVALDEDVLKVDSFLNHQMDVELFNEQLVSLSTVAGTLTIMGSELHISQLSLENGSLLVEGRIDALEYDDRQKRRGLSKLFK